MWCSRQWGDLEGSEKENTQQTQFWKGYSKPGLEQGEIRRKKSREAEATAGAGDEHSS